MISANDVRIARNRKNLAKEHYLKAIEQIREFILQPQNREVNDLTLDQVKEEVKQLNAFRKQVRASLDERNAAIEKYKRVREDYLHQALSQARKEIS